MASGLHADKVAEILSITESLSQIKDIDSLLDRVLFEARSFCGAEAGSIYLLEGDRLRIHFVQNDALLRQEGGKRFLYQNHAVPVDETSMAGHVAVTRKALIIADAYRLDGSEPYRFNRRFDETAGYRTCSVLTVPLLTSGDRLIGVMQIINPQDESGRAIPFRSEDELVVSHFAHHAAGSIEKARMTREIILRMVGIAALRDPEETAAHVNRVAAYAVEIYSRWAVGHGVPEAEIKRVRDILRIAAMLHDVGKVAISDSLLKKCGPLDEEEVRQMRRHVVFGAQLFRDTTSDWDDMAAAIALNHHERWDGSGYPGRDDGRGETGRAGAGKTGCEIPLYARVVALADVYDALTSRRAYKEAWPDAQVERYIREQRGRQFDPEMVDAFFAVYDVIRAIRSKYGDS